MLKKFMTRKTTKASKRKEFLSGLQFETLERRELLAGDLGAAYADVAEGEGGDHGAMVGVAYLTPGVNLGGGGYVSQPVLGLAPRDVAIQYMQANAADFGAQHADYDSYRILSEFVSQHTRVTHVVLQQQYNGLDVENSIANIAVDNDGRIVMAGSNFVTGLVEDSSQLSFSPATNSVDALQAIASELDLTIDSMPEVLSVAPGGSQAQELTGGGVASGNVSAELRYQPTAGGDVALSWVVEFLGANGDAKYRGVVNAETGDVDYVYDMVRHATYNVYELPGQSPLDTTPTNVTDAVVDLEASPFGWHDTNGIAGSEFTDTRGNNVFAQGGDIGAGYNATGVRANGGEDLVFNFPYDDLSHSTVDVNIETQTVHGFYVMNVLHDVYHNYGFDEAAGNYQATNYTGTGVPGDQIILNVADPDAPCNAYYVPGIDGEVGVIEMGFCNFAVPDVGSTLENSILVHEHGHALVHRLVSGPLIGSGVQTGFAQPDAMHEGHADFLALWFEMDKNDTPEQPEISGEYYFNNPDGIRRQPYSYDMSVNPITFDSYNALPDANGVPNNESHNAGEIWASVLHDMTWELIFKYGGAEDASAMELAFNEDVYQSVGNLPGFTGPFAGQPGLPITTTLGVDPIDFTTGANNLALQLVIDGMKLTPYAATFDNARDGILAADIALTGGVNHDVIWKAFARRGLGYSAFSGIDQDAEVVAAAYDLPPSPADIAGTAFLDADGDGVRDLGEAPIAGVQLFMDLNGNGTHERLEPWTITDSDGDYNFVLYTGGAFTVKAIQQDDMQQTLPDPTQIPGGPVNHGGHDVYVVTGHSTANVDFGFAPNEGDLGINGMKFNDVNSNGVMDPGEVGVAGVFIYIDKDMDGRIDLGEPATRSAEDGSYYIEFNEGGTYHVREVVEPGWTQVSPAAGYHEVVIVPGLANYDIDFANGKSSDFGDLPITFDGSNPASHGLLDGLHLGTAVDADPGPNNGVQANGDDNTGLNDDDGVVFIDNLVRGMDDVTMEVTASIGDNSSALLNAWIDFDGDGIFDGANEQIVANLRLEEGVNSIDFAIPANAQVGASYARFRYGYEYNFGPNGDSLAGEVEDYRLDASFSGGIVDDNPIAVDDTFNVSPEDGPAQQLDVLANDFGSSNGAASLVLPAINPIVTVQGGSALVNLTLGMVLYTPPAEYAGPDSFDYEITDGAGEFSTATVAINVLPIFTEPEAVDDFIRVPENTLIGQPQIIDVLDNDIVGSNGPLTIASVTPSTEGHVVVNLAGNTLSYTLDSSDEWGLDSFEYSIVDSTGTPVKTATVTIECTPPENTVEYIVEAVDSLSGSTITTVEEGEQFTIRVSVKDSRGASVVAPADAGVYAGYVDLLYDADHLQVVPNTLNHGTIFTDITQGTADLPGLIDEVGGVQDGVDQSSFDRGTGAMELFTIDVTAIASTSGSLTALEADPINASPLHDTVVIAPSPASVDLLDILYSFTTIEITSPAEGESLLDTNGDGAVTPIDALGIINQLNTFGTGAVAEGETFGLDQAMDVNRDSFVSPLDALAIINYLNDNASEMGEGEAVGIVEQTTINTSVAGNQVSATEAVSADIIDEYLRVRENEIGLSYFTGGSQDVVEEDSSDLESAIDDLADDVFGQW